MGQNLIKQQTLHRFRTIINFIFKNKAPLIDELVFEGGVLGGKRKNIPTKGQSTETIDLCLFYLSGSDLVWATCSTTKK